MATSMYWTHYTMYLPRFKKDGKSYQLSKKRLDQESITIPSKHCVHDRGDWAFLQARTKPLIRGLSLLWILEFARS